MKLSIISKEFIHNKNIVVCVLKVKPRTTTKIGYLIDGAMDYPDIITVSGKAKCSKYDKFDSNFGEILAESRAFEKLYKRVLNAIDKVSSQYEKELKELHSIIDRYTDLLTNEKEQQYEENVVASVKNRIAHRKKSLV